MKAKSKGFTLVELMLVVVIIGILVSMITPRLVGRSEEAKIAATKADIHSNLSLALDLFRMDNGRYPTTEEGLKALLQTPGGMATWRGPYLRQGRLEDHWNRQYLYHSPGAHNGDFDLASTGQDSIEGNQDDITNWNQ